MSYTDPGKPARQRFRADPLPQQHYTVDHSISMLGPDGTIYIIGVNADSQPDAGQVFAILRDTGMTAAAFVALLANEIHGYALGHPPWQWPWDAEVIGEEPGNPGHYLFDIWFRYPPGGEMVEVPWILQFMNPNPDPPDTHSVTWFRGKDPINYEPGILGPWPIERVAYVGNLYDYPINVVYEEPI